MGNRNPHNLWCEIMVKNASSSERKPIPTVKDNRKNVGIRVSGYSRGYLARELAELY